MVLIALNWLYNKQGSRYRAYFWDNQIQYMVQKCPQFRMRKAKHFHYSFKIQWIVISDDFSTLTVQRLWVFCQIWLKTAPWWSKSNKVYKFCFWLGQHSRNEASFRSKIVKFGKWMNMTCYTFFLIKISWGIHFWTYSIYQMSLQDIWHLWPLRENGHVPLRNPVGYTGYPMKLKEMESHPFYNTS